VSQQGKILLSKGYGSAKLVDAQIDFVKNPQGQVTHLVLHQDGRDVKITRK